GVHAAAVVAHLDADVAAAVAGIELQVAIGRFALANAHVRLLDAVVDAVADEMDQRIADLLEHGFVELGLLTGHGEFDLFAEALREVAHHARETAEDEADRQHAHAHDAVLQLAHVAFELGQAQTELLGGAAFEVSAQLTQHGLSDDQLADRVHQLV